MTDVHRRRFVVRGVVQGVGFRPYVYRLAQECELSGFVRNDASHVHIEVEGRSSDIERFSTRLESEVPPLGRIASVETTRMPSVFEPEFCIAPSGPTGHDREPSLIPPDTAVCDDCVRELFDPADRRYRHPFITCTNCGPRFTIINALPYDRPNTTMGFFDLCAVCRKEYADPNDRRYHAQPLACPRCGPTLRHERDGQVTIGTDVAIASVQADLAEGLIVAIKGLGGYHLAVDATNDAAVNELRRRKARADKPFAVMVPDLNAARRVARVGSAEASALQSPAHPIVLLRARTGSCLADGVAPGNPLVGVLLSYTPLHHLLFARGPDAPARVPTALVMTSGNVAEEPICFDDVDAHNRLDHIADSFCTHNRPIHTPCDDSVIRLLNDVELPIRRSRGYAPLPVQLPMSVPPTLAVGGEMKNTFAIATDRTAWLSQHLGDMGNLETLNAFEASVARFIQFYGVNCAVIAVDAHPGYQTRRWAMQHKADLGVVKVQHHHAHLASLMVEHSHDGTEPVIGFVFDGTGYGNDGTLWGGEILLGDYAGFERWGHLREVLIPGGDSAANNPCRTALAHLHAAGVEWADELPPVIVCDEAERRVLAQQLAASTNCVASSSMGRLFDATASLLGLRHRITYEAQAAIELEVLAGKADRSFPLAFSINEDGSIDPTPVVRGVVDAVRAGVDTAAVALGFHDAVVEAMVACAASIREERLLSVVGLTGGVFQNVLLTQLATARLREYGFDVLTHRLVPPNDGGLALGQAMVAAHRRGRVPTNEAATERLDGRWSPCV